MIRRAWWWVGGGAILLALLGLATYLLRDTVVETPPLSAQPASVIQRSRTQPEVHFAESVPQAAMSLEAGAITNAADVYRQAFALFDALSAADKETVANWQSNVTAAVAAELCEKIRPIGDLMQAATQVTNCDWGLVKPLRPNTPFVHLAKARALARLGVWRAQYCQAGGGAAEDIAAVLRLGQQVDDCMLIGSLVDVAIENLALSCVASNLSAYVGNDWFLDLLGESFAGESASRAIQMEADFAEQVARDIAAKSPEQITEYLTAHELTGPVDWTVFQAEMKTLVAIQRELAGVLATGDAEQFEDWLRRYNSLNFTTPLTRELMAGYDKYFQKIQTAVVNHAMVTAALAVVTHGVVALQRYPDPSTEQPFTYQKIHGGFELQSAYNVNDKPLKIFFPIP
ncbi:MAG: hypothetical protein PCFJNLEI_01831 [Verrucomicrobiae bacterium]|nr:hypothetical protein [Verrucomicrobiae bacterium]